MLYKQVVNKYARVESSMVVAPKVWLQGGVVSQFGTKMYPTWRLSWLGM